MSNNQGVWCSKCYGDHYTNDCPEPVASVEAKEKEISNSFHWCRFCSRVTSHVPKSGNCLNCGTIDQYVAEPKPTPSAPADEPCEWYGRNVGPHDWINTPDGWKRCANCKREYKPQPDSSSIPEQTFEQWWNSHGRLFLAGDDVHVQRCVMNISERAWNAAKGQSNGR